MTAPFFALEPYWERIQQMTPMKRVGNDGELDAALLFLASDASSFMTGASLVIDGGVSCTVGGTDYEPVMFEAMVDVAGEFGKAIGAAY